ncbi:MAG: VWA domain-containing protein [Deltaproteobacteria bacterium]|jgi:serine/threonine-protein kinase PpkA|nr:VWA domain-containing protein [Deltaproteobacteria bacterium]
MYPFFKYFRNLSGICGIFGLTLFMVLGLPSFCLAAERNPLLLEGKSTLYQRVLIRPAAVSFDSIQSLGDYSRATKLVPFSVYYVYEKLEENGQFYYLCGTGTKGEDLVWIEEDFVAQLNQSMVAVLAERAGRGQILFFKENHLPSLLNIANSAGIGENLDRLSDEFQTYLASKEKPPEDFPLEAAEPSLASGAIVEERFYIMPIFENVYSEEDENLQYLRVGSIDPGESDAMVDTLSEDLEPPKIGIVFVIDTTKSMGPYIEACREISQAIYDLILQTDNADNIFLAFVAFRSSVEASPDIEYTTKVISDFTGVRDRDSFAKALSEVKATEVSTHSFNEDSLAGLNTAINDLNWEPLNGGILILLTDAGPLTARDGYRSSDDTPFSVHERAAKRYREKDIKIIPIHLKTPEGARSGNHTQAQKAYQELAFTVEGKPSYLPIDLKNPADGPRIFSTMTQEFVKRMNLALTGVTPQTDDENLNNEDCGLMCDSNRFADLIGLSLRLDYLGRHNETSGPILISSWISDKDLRSYESDDPVPIPAVEAAVLMTRQQLSTLYDTVKAIVDGARNSLDSDASLNFFSALKSATSRVVRDPSEFVASPDTPLSEMIIASEFLEGLPYKSRIMTFSEQAWNNMMPVDREGLINELEGKLDSYRIYENDDANWGKFATDTLDHLYRVPLVSLP